MSNLRSLVLIGLSIGLACVGGLPAFAQAPNNSGVVIAVVDMQRVIESAPQFVSGRQRVIAEFSAVEAKLKVDEATLQTLKKRRELEAPLMSKANLDELIRTIEASERALRRGRDDLKQRLSQRTNEVVRDLDRELGEVIAEVAKARGADTVISSTATVYTNPRLDITDAVLQKLRSGTPK